MTQPDDTRLSRGEPRSDAVALDRGRRLNDSTPPMSRSAPRLIAFLLVPLVALCAIAAAVGAWRLHHRLPGAAILQLSDYFSLAWVGWDSGWYKLIAEQG